VPLPNGPSSQRNCASLVHGSTGSWAPQWPGPVSPDRGSSLPPTSAAQSCVSALGWGFPRSRKTSASPSNDPVSARLKVPAFGFVQAHG